MRPRCRGRRADAVGSAAPGGAPGAGERSGSAVDSTAVMAGDARRPDAVATSNRRQSSPRGVPPGAPGTGEQRRSLTGDGRHRVRNGPPHPVFSGANWDDRGERRAQCTVAEPPRGRRREVAASKDSFGARSTLTVDGTDYDIFRLDAVEGSEKLPFSLKVLLENLLRTEDGEDITADHIRAIANWDPNAEPDQEIQFTPARVVMQDFTGVPCIVDLATMREAMAELGGDPQKINPLAPAEMVIDHSVIADIFGTPDSFERNVEIEYERNGERYQFLRWGQGAFSDFKVVPPGTGIVHQVNIEHLARVIFPRQEGDRVLAYPDTCVGTDCHTTMVNGLGVLGWGVGGIEAEAAMLGQPVSMLIPRVVGFKLTGELPDGATATDLVLTITEMLREHGVVGKFVEFYGAGVSAVPLANRATIGNMSPEFGSTAAMFPIDEETITYLELTGRSQGAGRAGRGLRQGAGPLARRVPRAGVLRVPRARPRHDRPVDRRPEAPAGPRRDHRGQGRRSARRCRLRRRRRCDSDPDDAAAASRLQRRRVGRGELPGLRPGQPVRARQRPGRQAAPRRRTATAARRPGLQADPRGHGGRHGDRGRPRPRRDRRHHLLHQHLEPAGDDRRRAAGQERRRARADQQAVGEDDAGPRVQGRHGLLREGRAHPVPGEARLLPGRLRLHDLHRQLRPAARAGQQGGQRGRPRRRLGALGQPQLRGPDQPRRQDELPGLPPLVIAYALAGSMDVDLNNDPLGQDPDGNDVFLHDIWPSPQEVQRVIDHAVSAEMFSKDYADVFAGTEQWQNLPTPTGDTFEWDPQSTYVRQSPVLRRACRPSRPRSRTSPAPAPSRCSATR